METKKGAGKRGPLKKVLIVLGALAVLVVLYFIIVSPLFLAKYADSSGGVEAVQDTRLETTRNATRTADEQAYGGDVPGAYSTLDDAIAKTPRDAVNDLISLYESKSVVASNAEDKDNAITAQKKAIELAPNNWQLYESLAEVYDLFGDKTNAKATYDKAREVAAKNGEGDEYHGIGGTGEADTQ